MTLFLSHQSTSTLTLVVVVFGAASFTNFSASKQRSSVCYKLTNFDGSLVGVVNSSGCLFCAEQFGTNGAETGVKPVPPSISESKLNIPVDGVCMATPLISVAGLLSTFNPRPDERGIVGSVVGRCLATFKSGLFKAFKVLTTIALFCMLPNVPKLTGAVVTIGVCNDAEAAAAANDGDSVAIFGNGGGIIGLLLESNMRLGDGGPPIQSSLSNEFVSKLLSSGSSLMCGTLNKLSFKITGFRSIGELRPVDASVVSMPVIFLL